MRTRDALFAEVQEYVRELVKNNVRFTMVGGDHSVTIPVERGIDDALDEEFRNHSYRCPHGFMRCA